MAVPLQAGEAPGLVFSISGTRMLPKSHVSHRQHTNLPTRWGDVGCLAYSPDGKTLVTGGSDGTLRLWDPATGKQRGWVLPRRPGAMVYAIRFSADGKALVAACGAEVRLWDVRE